MYWCTVLLFYCSIATFTWVKDQDILPFTSEWTETEWQYNVCFFKFTQNSKVMWLKITISEVKGCVCLSKMLAGGHFHSRLWLVIVGKAQVLLITLRMTLFRLSVPTVWHWASTHNTGTLKPNQLHLIQPHYTCAFPTVTCHFFLWTVWPCIESVWLLHLIIPRIS